MNIEDIEMVGFSKIKITFTDDEVNEVLTITLERSQLKKLEPFIDKNGK